MIKNILIFFFVFFFHSSVYSLELVKVEANENFDRIDIWSGKFIDLSGNLWDTSEYYSQENESFNTSLFLYHEFNKFSFTSKYFWTMDTTLL